MGKRALVAPFRRHVVFPYGDHHALYVRWKRGSELVWTAICIGTQDDCRRMLWEVTRG